MELKSLLKLKHKLPKDTVIVVRDTNGNLFTDWPMEIKYTSEGKWIIMID